MGEPIAIIGSACRFAGGATSPSKLWELLNNPRDVRNDIPKSRFNAEGYYHPNSAYHGHSNIRHSYLLEQDVAAFDTEFFGIKPIEAKAIDPQQRLLMETVYEGLESAGLTIDGLRGSDTAVYFIPLTSSYPLLNHEMNTAPTYTATGIGRSILSNRISYFFDWHGPSITLDTACSSSLVAVHLAVQSLRSGESRVALACGSNLCLGPENYIFESKLKMLSPDGRSKMWDKDANGYARGDGVAACIFKTLSAAIEDGDDIECIIRETGLNQDGATTGITMPSAVAQQALIRSTYAKAGLDLSKSSDRPQFFEAHGTGTPAGDPIEAEAIARAFFGENFTKKANEPLYVGSIKTILGHTEGTAGLAALMKASLALRSSTLPPNMLLNSLSDRVAPFAKNLEIPTTSLPWPKLPPGQPRRASVNSFGFGGANAHAIVESYTPSRLLENGVESSGATQVTPFVFSALTRQSLRASLSEYADFISRNPSINLRDLAYTLHKRRSAFPYRVSFAVNSAEELVTKLRNEVQATKPEDLGVKMLPSSNGKQPKILCIFTGQGAQYTRMGAELIEKSATARNIIRKLQSHLDQLPEELRPDWSLEAELLAAEDSSRVTKGAYSSLSTAVQIMLVDLLRLAGVKITAIVGHSSGEMAAAYAAGYLTARDAICVAYFRGHFVSKMSSPNGVGIKGAMLAAGLSEEDAASLCDDERFAGRVCVAAVNSSSSVTISGDEDAINEYKVILDDEKRFNRKLRVDKAYHSNHLVHCAAPYVNAILAAGVKAVEPTSKCLWVSSVYCRPVTPDMDLGDQYWAVNMIRPVLFHQALKVALETDDYDLVVEVGPHAALKGPASQTIQEVLGKALPYQGLLTRGTDAIDSTASCLGFLWSHLGDKQVDLNRYDVAVNDDKSAMRVVKGLPGYQWNHEASYWHESRATKKKRTQQQPFNQLLGNLLPDSAPHRLSWGHLLRVSELDWLSGHQVQSQTVFPAAGYVCTALEGARILAGERDVYLFELKDFIIHQAVTFNQDDSGIEVLTTLSDIRRPSTDHIHAKFSYSACLGSEDLTLVAEAELHIRFGEPSEATLPQRAASPPHMISVDSERFYSHLETLGYGFAGSFKSLSSLRRKLGISVCAVKSSPRDSFGAPLLVHPAEFDGAIQSLILAYSYPDDDQLLAMHLPTRMGSIRINPRLCKSMINMTVDSKLGVHQATGFLGDVNLYTNDSRCAAIQMEGIKLVPLGALTVDDDRKVFSKYHWVKNSLDGELAARDTVVGQNHEDILMALERISTYYLRQFDQQVPADSPLRKESPHSYYLRYARHIVDLVQSGNHKWAQKEWLNDSLEDMLKATARFSHLPDARVMHLVGEQMPRVFKGETNMLEEFRVNDVLDDYYEGGFGFLQSGLWMSRTISQLAERYPHLNILEIGAGTGGATKRILKHLGSNFLTYTFTDVSSGFFERGAEVFAEYKDRMVFKTLDCGQNPITQGYSEGAYDVVVASLVIHATPDMEVTMKNLRKLVKPGGFLVVADGSNNGQPHGTGGFIFGTLPGWWLGADSGRPLSPFVSTAEWDRMLRASGFSGIDSTAPKAFEDVIGMTVFASQAIDDRISFLREPLSSVVSIDSAFSLIPSLVIVGGTTPETRLLVQSIKDTFKDLSLQIHAFETLGDVDYRVINPETTVVSLTELDKPVFMDITPEEFLAFKTMFSTSMKLLWVTNGRLHEQPFSNMTVGFARTAVHEIFGLEVQNVDIADVRSLKPRKLFEMILRFQATTSLTEAERNQILWAIEPEIVVDAAGQDVVPRLRPISARNNRYNSARRPITQDVFVNESPSELHKQSDGWSLTQISRWGIPAGAESQIELEVSHALTSALKTSHGHRFLVLGTETKSQARFLALVPALLSIVHVPKELVVACPVSKAADADILQALAARVVSMTIVDPLVEGETLVVHNPTELLAWALASESSRKSVRVHFIADASQEYLPSSWIKLAPYMTQAEISNVLPDNTASFVGLSNYRVRNSENESTILSMLPPHCRKETAATLYSSVGWQGSTSSATALGQLLQRAVDNSQMDADQSRKATSGAIPIDDLINGFGPENPDTVIDWTLSKPHPVRVSRLDSAAFFKSDKTYWMCGLSGALGISLCDWMIDRGARYLVLTSRNPKISPNWIEAHKQNGVNVTIIPCDVTNEPALRAAHKTICDTLPPIIGVLNGAMVLRDVSIQNMSYEQMSDVVQPKVLGSIHLDRIFHNENLDFFILFSSINCVIGNLGQANYSAANTFMCSLAAQRRRRGLAATALNVGAIIGAGYMERESSKALDLTVSKMALMHLSEQDYHQIFAEGIDAGRPDSGDDAELTTGLLGIPAADGPNAPRWRANPTFSSFIVHQVEKIGGDGSNEAVMSIKDQLGACKSAKDVFTVVKRTFGSQLRNVLQMTTGDDDLLPMRSSDIGLDSLISVDIRSWFLKNFEVSIPVLKIMGNNTMADLAELVAGQVPLSLLPEIASSEAPAATEEAPTMVPPAQSPEQVVKGVSDDDGAAFSTDSSNESVSAYSTDASFELIEDLSTPSTRSPSPKNGMSAKPVEKIDWNKETALPLAAKVATGRAPAARPRVIVLTGVSGLLGRHLLSNLLQDPSVKEIICIAVRRLSQRLQLKELPMDGRISYFEGHLEQPRLGLSKEDAAQIFGRADAVIHNGADTSHLKFYPAIKAANTYSTREIISLCMARKVPIHFLSTVGVALLGNFKSFPEISVADYSPPVDGSHGYIAAKWASERLLENLQKQHGVNVWIHRPSTIIREGEHAENAAAQLDWMNALVAYMRKIKAVPAMKNLRGALDLVYVHNVTSSILKSVFENKPKWPSGGPTYFHQSGDFVLPLDKLKDFVERTLGVPDVKVLSVDQWAAQAVEMGLNRGIAALIEGMDDPGQPHYPRMLREGPSHLT
ncbi:polyketide synthase [Colletotrichum tofieldiae]|nr:polyketide synthase [Colletotrichum tofieldiae]